MRFERNAIVLAIPPRRSDAGSRQQASSGVRLELVNASAATQLVALQELPGRSNYFIGSRPEGWRTDVPRYACLKYVDVYPGIDLVLHGTGGALEYDFHVAPGANPEAIKVRLAGAQRVTLDEHGDLVARLASGILTQRRPRVFAKRGSRSREIQGRYRENRGTFSFSVERYAPDEELVIDPVVITSTYLGGDHSDTPYAMTIDGQGAIYITGSTDSTNFPVQGSYENDQLGEDVFVTKLDATASRVIFSTYLAAKPSQPQNFPYETGYGIAVDTLGNVYVTGSTGECGFPTTAGAFQGFCQESGGDDIFVTKLNPSGNALVYSTYIHGSTGGFEEPAAIAVDAAGRVYLAGTTDVATFPVTPGAFQTTKAGGAAGFSGSSDGFVAVLNPAGSGLEYATFLGGQFDDSINAMVIDNQGAVYVAGETFSSNFPTRSAYQSTSGGAEDAFVARLSPVLSTLEYSSYLGGSGFDEATAMTRDAEGNVFIGGSTSSTNFPLVRPLQPALKGKYDVFLTKLNGVGNALVYSTYLGGRDYDGFVEGVALAVDADGKLSITGATLSPDFPVVSAMQTKLAGEKDAFLSRISADGSSILFSTFLGGAEGDAGRALALGSSSRVYVAGDTVSSDFPVVSALQATHAQEAFSGIYSDVFLVVLDFSTVGRHRSVRH